MSKYTIPVFDLHSQYLSLKEGIDAAIQQTIASSSYINGKDNQEFDIAFAKYCEAKHAIGVSSGSAALDLVLEALGVSQGDEVICPSHTFAATAESVVHRGATPVFAEILEDTYNLNPDDVEKKITKKTKAIIMVHLYGQAGAMDRINDIAKKHNVFVVEDAAQAHGARYHGKRVGTMGDIACFSFFPAKNLGCYGDGGGVVTNSDNLAEKVRLLKDHGRVSKYEHSIVGYGERLDNLQAAILLAKLPSLEAWNTRRREIARQYSKNVSKQYVIPHVDPAAEHVFYVYTVRHPKREAIQKYLEEHGISTGVYYPKPLHLQEAFADLGYKVGDFPTTERVAKEIFSIPVYPELTDDQVHYIIETMNQAAIEVGV